MHVEPGLFGIVVLIISLAFLALLLWSLRLRDRRLDGWRDFVRFVYEPATYKAAKEASEGSTCWPHGWDVIVRCMKGLGAGQYHEVKRMVERVNSKVGSKLGVTINIVWDAPVHGSIERL